MRQSISGGYAPPLDGASSSGPRAQTLSRPLAATIMEQTQDRNMNTNAKPAKSGSRKRKSKCITEQNVALSNGMKIWQDSLADYSAKRTASKSCASPATRKKRPSPGEWISESAQVIGHFDKGEKLTEKKMNKMVDKIYQTSAWFDDLFPATYNPNPTMKLEKDIKESIPSLSGRRIRLSSLRPGDWVDICGFTPGTIHRCYVVQNWPSLRRIEFCWPDHKYETARYENIVSDAMDDVTYVGKGERRKWWKSLPKFLRAMISEYSQP